MLLFDKTNHSGAINISADGLSVRRTTGFANGIIFSNRSINIFEKVTFEIQQQPSSIWQGSLRLGLYAGHQIPNDDLPLSTMDASLSRSYTMVSLEKYVQLYNGIRLTVWLTPNHGLNYAINHVLRGTLIDGNQIHENDNVLLPLRLVFDLFGNTIKVQLIRDGRKRKFFRRLKSNHIQILIYLFYSDDIVPYEIKARGTDAIRHFQAACDTGTISVRRTLLLIVGPKSSGKTQLKQLLVTNNDM